MYLQVELLGKLGSVSILCGNIDQNDIFLTIRLAGIYLVSSLDRLPPTIPQRFIDYLITDEIIARTLLIPN